MPANKPADFLDASSEPQSVASSPPPYLFVTRTPQDDPRTISVDSVSEPRAREAEAFFLQGHGDGPYELLSRIRSHAEMHVYLKPVFWVSVGDPESKVEAHVDGTWRYDDDQEIPAPLLDRAAVINRGIATLQQSGASGESSMELRILRFMATRQNEFSPYRTANNTDGFVYPRLWPLLPRGGNELVQILSTFEGRRLVTGTFFMRQHACQSCHCGFLNFQETCPECGSANIETDDLVHHFRCAYTGPMHEFDVEKGQRVCPKCDRKLKQIGVDYDKPSLVHTCRRCNEQFQDPYVETTCHRCGRTHPPEQQNVREIKKYEITALGKETAIHGLSSTFRSSLERESRVLDYPTFQVIVESEAARIERYQRHTSSLLLIRLTGLQELRIELGNRVEEVIGGMATAFADTVRTSDYLAARGESLYLFLLTETDTEGARRAGERLYENVQGVLDENLSHPPQLKTEVEPVTPDITLDAVVEDFLTTSG